MPAFPRDPPAQPEADGASGSGQPPPAATHALDELHRAAQAARALHAGATAVLDADLDRAGRSLGRGVWIGVRTAVLLGAILLAGVVGGVLVCVGASGLLAARLQLGPDATLLLEGSALLICAAIATGAAWFIRRRMQAALSARRQAARQALATSAADLADAVAHAADPRPWFEEHPLAGLAAALVAGLAAGRTVRRRHPRAAQPAAQPDAPPGHTAPGGPAEPRASGSDPVSELAALVLSLGVPLIERLLEGDAPPDDTDD